MMARQRLVWWASAASVAALAIGLRSLRHPPPPPQPLQAPTPAQFAAAFPGNSRTIFENSDSFILYSLDPDSVYMASPEYDEKQAFHGFRIIGKTLIKDAGLRKQIRLTYYDGLARWGQRGACCNPRHGIRATRMGQTLDLSICFHCGDVEIFLNDKEQGEVAIGQQAQATLDRILTAAGVQLAPPPPSRVQRWKRWLKMAN